MKLSDWAVEITRIKNGFVCKYPDAYDDGREHFETEVFSDSDDDELKSGEDLLWWIINHFGLSGSKWDKERLGITRAPGDDYEPPIPMEKQD